MESNGAKTLSVSSEKRPTLNSVTFYPLPILFFHFFYFIPSRYDQSFPIPSLVFSYQIQSKSKDTKSKLSKNISADIVQTRVEPTRANGIG